MYLDSSFLTIDAGFQPSVGRLLVAEPFMNEPYFGRSVILLTQHSNLGSMGLVLNKPLKLYLHEILEGVKVEENIPVFCGGPVGSKSLFYLHNLSEVPQSFQIAKNLYLGGDFEWLMDNLNAGLGTVAKVRFFLGYAGWDEGQLLDEIKNQSWLVTKMATEEILRMPGYENLWSRSMQSLGGKYKRWAEFPQNPNLN
ncbi:YqgE/AlgH family protein [Paludibacter sp.]|uniref:YqgE/AlgH family protein n=1 Tax=Paludibacter sp. TaxID=1898105 RepID=UPI001352AA17|nr:YqgE/AlgH family protein [Paludibacter sp.]MTK53559.1 YqgE/AlgH family protein [Paludibacter sp.]